MLRRYDKRMEHSKYYNLDIVEDGWTKEEQDFAILTLESLSYTQLKKLLEVFEIVFSNDIQEDDKEEMIGVILVDSTKDELLAALHEIISPKG